MSMILALASVYSCLVIGDETAQRVSRYKPECAIVARPEATSATLQNYKPVNRYQQVFIAVGTSGHLNKNMGPNLFAIRKKFPGARITWIAPRNTRGQQVMFETATYFHDRIVYMSKIRPKGAVRDKDYKAIAKAL